MGAATDHAARVIAFADDPETGHVGGFGQPAIDGRLDAIRSDFARTRQSRPLNVAHLANGRT
jgi:hypothetical protein